MLHLLMQNIIASNCCYFRLMKNVNQENQITFAILNLNISTRIQLSCISTSEDMKMRLFFFSQKSKLGQHNDDVLSCSNCTYRSLLWMCWNVILFSIWVVLNCPTAFPDSTEVNRSQYILEYRWVWPQKYGRCKFALKDFSQNPKLGGVDRCLLVFRFLK